MRQFTIITVVATMSILLLSGCQESESSQIKRARVIGNENLQLKKQLEEKNQRIEDLEKEIEKVETEAAEKVEKAGNASIKTLRLLLESEKNSEALRLENEKLNEELTKLKAQ